MEDPAAIRVAIDLIQVPSRVRIVRSEPLPDGIDHLLRVAAGDDEATGVAAKRTGREPMFLQEAATFFVEQILMAPGNDSYRVLGADAGVPIATLRRHMALLLRWLHPDVADEDPRSVFAQRVNSAWEDLKTAERRQDYDAILGAAVEPPPVFNVRRRRSPQGSMPVGGATPARPPAGGATQRILRRLLGKAT